MLYEFLVFRFRVLKVMPVTIHVVVVGVDLFVGSVPGPGEVVGERAREREHEASAEVGGGSADGGDDGEGDDRDDPASGDKRDRVKSHGPSVDASGRDGTVQRMDTYDDLDDHLTPEWAATLTAYMDSQGDQASRDWVMRMAPVEEVVPGVDNPMLRYLIERAGEIVVDEGHDAAILWLAVHAWREGILDGLTMQPSAR